MVRTAICLLPVLVVACAAGPEGVAPPSPGGVAAGPAVPPGVPALGTVHTSGPEVWFVEPDGAAGTRYCLDGDVAYAALKVEGQRVRFAGAAGEIPPNVRLACSPFTYSSLAPATP